MKVKNDILRPPPPPPNIDISSSWGGTLALASRRMVIRSRACLALSVVKYVYDVPFIPARYEKAAMSGSVLASDKINVPLYDQYGECNLHSC